MTSHSASLFCFLVFSTFTISKSLTSNLHCFVLFLNPARSAKAALCNYRILLSLSLSQPVEHSFERLQTKTELQAALRDIAQSLRAIINAEMITYSPIGM